MTGFKQMLGMGGACIVMASGAYGYQAQAGAHLTSSSVTINGLKASGSYGATRNSTTNGSDYLLCGLTGTVSSLSAFCIAANGTNAISCSTTNSHLVAALQKMPTDGYVSFTKDSSGNCTFVEVDYESQTEIKKAP